MRFFFHIDPAVLDETQWAFRAKEVEWILKKFYPDLVGKKK